MFPVTVRPSNIWKHSEWNGNVFTIAWGKTGTTKIVQSVINRKEERN